MKVVLLDRDGVLNEDRADYVKNPGELVLIPGVGEAIAKLNGAGLRIAIVSNQSAVGRGIISQGMLDEINARLLSELRKAGAKIDLFLVCTDAPGQPSQRRKPAPGMLREALTHFRAQPLDAVMIGDQVSDLLAAKAAGCARFLVRTGKGAQTQAAGLPADVLPVAVYNSLMEAAVSLVSKA
jgi:D-glycero-D-manno-heptose 1,7-bisphosphate phosphatase